MPAEQFFIIRFKHTLGFADIIMIILCVNIQIVVVVVCLFYTGYSHSVNQGEEGCHDLQAFCKKTKHPLISTTPFSVLTVWLPPVALPQPVK